MSSKVLSFVVRYGLAVGVAVLVTLQVVQWFHPPTGTLIVAPQKPYEAPQSPIVKGVERTVTPAKIETLKPTEKETKKVEKALGGKLPAGPLVSVREIKELCQGGKLVLTLEPADVTQPEGVQRVVATVFPNKVPFFEWTLKRELSVSYGKSFGNVVGPFVHLDLRQELARTGPVEWFVGGGAFIGQGWSNAYAEAGAVVTF